MRAYTSGRFWHSAMLVALFAFAGCAKPLYVQTSGTAGPLHWEAIDLEPGHRNVDGKEVDVYDFTLVVRETRGIGLSFNSVLNTVYGGGWVGWGGWKDKFELPGFCELYLPLTSKGYKAPLWYVTLTGTDAEGRPVHFQLPVALPSSPGAGDNTNLAKSGVGEIRSGSLSSLVTDERRRLRIVTDIFDPKVVTPFFASDETRKVAPVAGATVVFDPELPHSLHRGLRNLAGGLLGGSLRLNSIVTVPLELPAPFSVSGAVRFTYAALEPRPDKCARVIIIEHVRGIEPASAEIGAAIVQRHGIRVGPGWSESELQALYTVLERVPDPWLRQVEGLTFRREKLHPANLGGEYASNSHTITMYDAGFRPFTAGFYAVDRNLLAIAHEIGHAFDFVALHRAVERYNASIAEFEALRQKDVRPSQASNVRQVREKSLGADDATLFGAASSVEAARSLSGSRWLNQAGVGFVEVEAEDAAGSGFRTAAGLDGAVRITQYAEENWGEYFADCFSLYVLEPQLLELLRPNIYGYFSKQFPR